MRRYLFFVIVLSAVLLIGGCSSNNDAAGQAVEEYLQALVDQDADRLSTLSCADWEMQAIMELDSFQAVSATLDGMSCEKTGEDGEYALVVCQGQIKATYNEEQQELDLNLRTYQVLEDGGEWLVCGYQ